MLASPSFRLLLLARVYETWSVWSWTVLRALGLQQKSKTMCTRLRNFDRSALFGSSELRRLGRSMRVQLVTKHTVQARMLEQDNPPTPHLKEKDGQQKSSHLHVPSFGSLLHSLVGWSICVQPASPKSESPSNCESQSCTPQTPAPASSMAKRG